MKVEILIGYILADVRRISKDEVELVFEDKKRYGVKALRIEAGIYSSPPHPDGVAELRMKMKGVAVDEEDHDA